MMYSKYVISQRSTTASVVVLPTELSLIADPKSACSAHFNQFLWPRRIHFEATKNAKVGEGCLTGYPPPGKSELRPAAASPPDTSSRPLNNIIMLILAGSLYLYHRDNMVE